jgi:hypothetical protein
MQTMMVVVLTLIFQLVLLPHKVQAQAPTVDIEIVLAVDASGSVDRHELKLQLDGIAAAFRDPQIIQAISAGPFQKIYVSALIWSDATYQKHPTDWFIVESTQSGEKFAATVEKMAIQHGALTAIGGGGTGLGSGLEYALGMLEENGVTAIRKVVDISGDGRETKSWMEGMTMLPKARRMAAIQGVTVNGLAIQISVSDLAEYYRDNVLVGGDSFVLPANDFHDYARAIKKKLLRELSPTVIGHNPQNVGSAG